MPPRWPRKPTREDPAYRKLEDRINFAVHVALFTLVNSGAWFFKQLNQADWQWTTWLTLSWLAILALHFVYISAIADYSTQTKKSDG
ncbi:MAG: 2TM domain-containing protein [Halothece sp. Uz-M2-17]|nr:2TM domain-containing protein [Halothece sp. Uz-M2-17]